MSYMSSDHSNRTGRTGAVTSSCRMTASIAPKVCGGSAAVLFALFALFVLSALMEPSGAGENQGPLLSTAGGAGGSGVSENRMERMKHIVRG